MFLFIKLSPLYDRSAFRNLCVLVVELLYYSVVGFRSITKIRLVIVLIVTFR
ncbi:hypothetical protein LMOh7858_0294 [Listeria monocytogenes str. 4b H7858]|nr:hypothetical protein LMOh7858_0294 [Listeria monocytogenes str. 4b H7858] [Listeria monocytogenes serotype 4b str. H7858]